MVRRRHGADPVRRRHFAPFWSAVVAGVLITVATGVVAIAGMPATAQFAFAAGGLLIGVCIVPAIYVAQLVRDAEAQNRLFADLERGIGLHTDPVRVQQALAGTLGDPRLRLLSPAEAREPATPGPGRRRTPVRQGDRLLCVIEHDEVLTRQRGARLAMTAAAVLAMERKERLDQLAEANRRLREQIEQVRESRSRVAEAAAAERRRIQQDLHDNAQQRLLTVRARIDMARLQLRAGGDAPATLDRAHAELGDAVAGLRRLIQRIYPLSLTDGAPLTVHVRIPRLRWSPSLECTAYFVVAEALGNVYKHARAGRVVVAVLDGPGSLTVEVTDDGAGLPATAGPPVLRSLRDRVQAAGGCLTAGPGEPTGTRITAELPKEEPACVS
jgi:signal transduction histidine kinase